MTPSEIGQWLAEARSGSRGALGQALQACKNYLLLVANRELDPELQAKGGASDLVQETFLEAQRDFPQFHGETAEEWLGWLRRMLVRNLADFTRHHRDAARRSVGREVSLSLGEFGSQGPAAQDPTPSAQAQARERLEAFHRALNRLPEEYRRVILLRYEEQLPFEEIGRLLDRSANAARMVWMRAVERLKEELEDRS